MILLRAGSSNKCGSALSLSIYYLLSFINFISSDTTLAILFLWLRYLFLSSREMDVTPDNALGSPRRPHESLLVTLYVFIVTFAEILKLLRIVFRVRHRDVSLVYICTNVQIYKIWTIYRHLRATRYFVHFLPKWS